MNSYLDINCDLGEGYGNDAAIMPYIQSCNIACGGHAGDEQSMRKTIRLAMQHDVKIGVHPSYPDRKNFGRKVMDISADDLSVSLLNQIELFRKIAEEENALIHHIKLHGALYNVVYEDHKISETIIQSLKQLSFPFKLYTPENAVLGQLASDDIEIIHEVFIDRRYQDNLQLKPRSEKGAILSGNEEAWEQYWQFMNHQRVRSETGKMDAYQCTNGLYSW